MWEGREGRRKLMEEWLELKSIWWEMWNLMQSKLLGFSEGSTSRGLLVMEVMNRPAIFGKPSTSVMGLGRQPR